MICSCVQTSRCGISGIPHGFSTGNVQRTASVPMRMGNQPEKLALLRTLVPTPVNALSEAHGSLVGHAQTLHKSQSAVKNNFK